MCLTARSRNISIRGKPGRADTDPIGMLILLIGSFSVVIKLRANGGSFVQHIMAHKVGLKGGLVRTAPLVSICSPVVGARCI